ncbi:MAG: hypothetical protein ACJAYN_000789 [Bermanella sp.]|jgi:hypothetical protein
MLSKRIKLFTLMREIHYSQHFTLKGTASGEKICWEDTCDTGMSYEVRANG